MSGYYFALAACISLVLFLTYLLRRRRLREKYVVIWLVVAVSVCVLGAFPQLVLAMTRAAGMETPSNLLFATALLVLLGVCIQLSVEMTEVEEETRTLLEEVALLRYDVQKLSDEAVRTTDEDS